MGARGGDELRAMAKRLREAKAALVRGRLAGQTAVAVQALTFVKRDFHAKSKGGAAEADGGRWAPVKFISVAARLLKRKVGEPVLRSMPRGPEFSPNRAAILWRAATDPEWFPKFYAAVHREFFTAATGIDTGRLVGSLQVGRPGMHFTNVPGRIVLECNMALAFGFSVNYAAYFDRKRPIFPLRLAPWQEKRLEEIMARRIADALAKALNGA